MSWVQVHPPGTTSVASTKTQFQQNNLYIETTAKIDHYFNDATAANDGHHKFVQMQPQGVEPTVAAGMEGVYYLKSTALGTGPAPFFQSHAFGVYPAQVYSVPVGILAGDFVLAAGDTDTFNFATYPPMVGWIYSYNTASPRRSLGTNFVWNGVSCFVNHRNAGDGQWIGDDTGALVQYIYSAGSPTFIRIRSTAILTVNISISGILI